jgi:hypothetical protein
VPVATSGSLNYVFDSRGDSWQQNAIAGVTWYPFGRDTFPVTYSHGFTTNYAVHELRGWLGIFMGTSVNTLGNFTVGPSLEPFPGIQVVPAISWWNKATLQDKIIPCSGYGKSDPFPTAPVVTQTQTAIPSGGSPPVNTTTTITVNTVANCMNAGQATDPASIISGTTAPIENHLTRAFAIGIVFNNNLFSAFSGLK